MSRVVQARCQQQPSDAPIGSGSGESDHDGDHSGDWNRVKQALDRLLQKQSAHEDEPHGIEEVRRAQ